MSLLLALFGHGAMSDLSALLGEERKSNFGAVRSVVDPLRHGLCASMPHGDDAQWPTWTGPPSLIFSSVSPSGTAESEISLRTQNASIAARKEPGICTD